MSGEQERPESLPPELLLLLNAFRQEFDAKLGNLKLWGCLALVGGGTLGGVVSQIIAPDQTHAAFGSVLRFFT